MAKRWLLVPCLLWMAFLSGCSDAPEAEPPEAKQAAAEPAVAMRPVAKAGPGQAHAVAPWLRQRVPASALAYLRLPNVWAALGSGLAAENDPVAVTEGAYANAVAAIRTGTGRTVVPHIPDKLRPLMALMLQHLRSPLEAVVLPSAQEGVPVPSVLITALTDFQSPAALNAQMTALADSDRMIDVLREVADDGTGMLSIAGLPAMLRLQAADGRLFLYVTTAPDADAFNAFVTSLADTREHAMHGVEQQQDASGQGLFVWVNGKDVVKALGALKDHPAMAMVSGSGAAQIESVSLGMGGAGGLGRMTLMLEMPRVSFRNFLPLIKEPVTLSAAGVPGGVAVLGLPDQLDLERFEALLLLTKGPEEAREYMEFKQAFTKELGFEPEALLSTFGPDMVLMVDEAGYSTALRMRDRAGYEKIRDAMVKRFKMDYQVRDVRGQRIHQLRLPNVREFMQAFDQEADLGDGGENELLLRYVSQTGTLFWVEDGDYLIFASVPQILIDRHYIQARTPLRDWLREEQRMDPDGALLMFSTRLSGVPKYAYYFDIGVLGWLADYVGEPIDMFAFPTARELGLPKDGAYSLKLASTETALSLELGYEYNPAEILLGGGNAMGAVAVVGIVAAIAIPAYDSYMKQAKITASMATVDTLKVQVIQVVESQQRYPNAAEIDALDLGAFATNEYGYLIEPDTGVIEILYFMGGLDEGASVEFIPSMEGDRLSWRCESNLPLELLPAQCH